jgi:predicted branched-subunit amino acid permease
MSSVSLRKARYFLAYGQCYAGLRDLVPMLAALLPCVAVFGAVANANGFSLATAVLMSLLINSLSAQLVAIGLITLGVPWPAIVLTIGAMNLRHVIYSAALSDYVKKYPLWQRTLLAFLLTDELFALAVKRYQAKGAHFSKYCYCLAVGLALYGALAGFTCLGFVAANSLANLQEWKLEFAVSVIFIAFIIPYLNNKPMWIAVAVATVTAVLASSLPYNSGLVLAAGAGVISGFISEVFSASKTARAVEEQS